MAKLLPFVATLTFLLTSASGCLGIDFSKDEPTSQEAPTIGIPWENPAYAKIREVVASVPCQASAVSKTATSNNLKLLSVASGAGTGNVLGEMDVRGNLSVQARYNANGFVAYNISDPSQARSQQLFTYSYSRNLLNPTDSPNEKTFDIKFTKEGSNILFGLSDRIVIVDATQKVIPAAHFQRGFLKHPTDYRGESHMIATHIIGGTEYVFAVPSISGQGVLVAKVVGTAVAGGLSLVKVYTSTPGVAVPPQTLAPHDMFLMDEIVDGMPQAQLYLANGFSGIAVLDVSIPGTPKTLATVAPGVGNPPQSAAPTYYHSIQVAWIDGRRIVATSAEVGYNTVKIWDFTDLKKPTYLGQWVYDAQNPTNMQHNLQIVNATLFVAHYGQGFFAFDLRKFLNNTAGGLDAALVAHYQPDTPAGQVWDVLVKDGLIYVADITQGLRVLGYGCFRPGDPALTSLG